MWNPFRSEPTCPVEPEMADWIDGRFRWLQEQFGHDLPANVPVVLPTPEFFPDEYHGRDEDAQVMLRRVAQYMNVDPATLKLVLYSDSGNPVQHALGIGGSSTQAAGLYMRNEAHESGDAISATIGIEERQLADPMSLVATLAHELGHELLIGQGRLTGDEQDHEPLTDLLTVFLGMGIFTANSTIHDRGWTSGQWSGWRTSRQGYLNQREFGYALARFAVTRGEPDLDWARHVRPDVVAPMRAALRFLTRESR